MYVVNNMSADTDGLVSERTSASKPPFYIRNVPEKTLKQQVQNVVEIARKGRQTDTAPRPQTRRP